MAADCHEGPPLPTSIPIIQEPEIEYDNFYTPNNRAFYDSFKYATLDPDERRICLLRIHPLETHQDDKTMIRCDLLDNVPLSIMEEKYATLSYCAGAPEQTEAILVNDICFNAFANLGHALRQARHYWRKTYGNQEFLLWADQVCIDQSNTRERSHQVGFMGDIYATSKQVLICLSTEGDASGGMKWVQSLAQQLPLGNVYFQLQKCLKFSWQDEKLHHDWDAFIKTVLKSRWWTRAWVRQEFLRSRHAVFLASFESGDWKIIGDVIEVYRTPHIVHYPDLSTQFQNHSDVSCQVCVLRDYPERLSNDEERVLGLVQTRKKMHSSSEAYVDLLSSLDDANLCKASDPRDLIYAFLGLSRYTYGIIPDYTPDITLSDIYFQLAHNVILHTGDLYILRKAYQPFQPKGEITTPLWVPHWLHTQAAHVSKEAFFWTYPKDDLYVPFVTYTFKPDERGLENRILEAKGTLFDVLESESEEGKWRFRTKAGSDVLALGTVRVGDEIWLLHGTKYVFIFRRKGLYHQVVGEMRFHTQNSDIAKRIQDIAILVMINDSSILTISIC